MLCTLYISFIKHLHIISNSHVNFICRCCYLYEQSGQRFRKAHNLVKTILINQQRWDLICIHVITKSKHLSKKSKPLSEYKVHTIVTTLQSIWKLHSHCILKNQKAITAKLQEKQNYSGRNLVNISEKMVLFWSGPYFSTNLLPESGH